MKVLFMLFVLVVLFNSVALHSSNPSVVENAFIQNEIVADILSCTGAPKEIAHVSFLRSLRTAQTKCLPQAFWGIWNMQVISMVSYHTSNFTLFHDTYTIQKIQDACCKIFFFTVKRQLPTSLHCNSKNIDEEPIITQIYFIRYHIQVAYLLTCATS